MKYKKDGNNLVIYLEGRITSENALNLEKECFAAIEEIFPNGEYEWGLELDCTRLEMVSSAGLRVILKLKKKYGNVKVTNVLPDVYEIFEITGLAQMMTVERAYRQVSIDGLREIATGAVGTVYEYDEDTILKVFRQDTPIEILKQEQEMAKKAFVVGVSTAIQQGVVKVGDSYGILFEYLRDGSVGDQIRKDPDNLEIYVSKFVEALKNMNGIDCSGMNLLSVKDTYTRAIDNREKIFGKEKADKLRRWLEVFPDGNSFIHGDFHPRNMKFANGEVVLIDMGDISIGHPAFDVMVVDFTARRLAPELSAKRIGVPLELQERYWKAVVGNYFHVEDEAKIAEITECMDAIGAFRQATVHGIVTVPEDYMLECAKRIEEEVFPNIDKFMELTVKACRLIDEAQGK